MGLGEGVRADHAHPSHRKALQIVQRLTAAGTVLAGMSALMSIGNTLFMPRLQRTGPAETHERVVVCIPARDEESTVPLLIGDLRAQAFTGELRVIVLDDNSNDGTLAAARRAADGDPRITVAPKDITPAPGWTGKAAACAALADLVFQDSDPCDVIAFVDADVRLSPEAIAASVGALREHDAAMMCPWPTQTTGSLVEHLVQPLLSYSWMSTLAVPLANRSSRPSLAVACGQFLVFDAQAYRDIGGHSSVASSATEDLDIARSIRRNGQRTILISGAGFVSCRMYDNWTDLRAGYTRWLWSAFGGAAGTTITLTAVALMYLAPPAAAVLGSGRMRRLGLAGYLTAVVARLSAERSESTSRPVDWTNTLRSVGVACAHPISTAIFMALAVDSRRRSARNELSWKGRTLNAPANNAAVTRGVAEK